MFFGIQNQIHKSYLKLESTVVDVYPLSQTSHCVLILAALTLMFGTFFVVTEYYSRIKTPVTAVLFTLQSQKRRNEVVVCTILSIVY